MSGLSKTRYLQGLQCKKRLYLESRKPELRSPITSLDKFRFAQGIKVGEFARTLYPVGKLVKRDGNDRGQRVQQTSELIQQGHTVIFEAAFEAHGMLIEADIITRTAPGKPWHLVEVKSTTSISSDHIKDAGIQYWVMDKCGHAPSAVFIMHLNADCVYPDLEHLLIKQDITFDAQRYSKRVENNLLEFTALLTKETEPQIDIGPYCLEPYACRFKGHCFDAAGVKENSIFELPSIGINAWKYYRQGIKALSDLPPDDFDDRQKNIILGCSSGQRTIEKKALLPLLDWEWPLHFLDFETVGAAIPRFAGTRPYQQIPFQFSCHILNSPDDEPIHYEYLHQHSSDPRNEVGNHLIHAIRKKGSIVAYKKSVEEACILELSSVDSPNTDDLKKLVKRLVDPLPLVRAGVYDLGFRGSFSLKRVAKSLCGSEFDYEGLEIGDGMSAQLTYMELMDGEVSPVEHKKVISEMKRYCGQDTWALLNVTKWLLAEAKE